MSEYSKAMLKAGYLNEEGKKKLEPMGKGQKANFINSLSDEEAEELADEEMYEEVWLQPALEGEFAHYYGTGYPEPDMRYFLILENFDASIEESYYWVLSQMRRDQSFKTFYKITDTFTASEQSAFWGSAQSRMKIQQDTVSQYLAAIGKMVKDLFQIVRELRIIDERLELYDNWDVSNSADITLKGLFIDLVEGGSKSPSSVYGLAQQVGFTILPDLFFNTHIYDKNDLDEKIDNMKYNKAIKNVLKRKLLSYIIWKDKTDKEIRVRRKFQLKYLRQHWAVIKMYLDWIKPYLKNIKRMRMNEKMTDSVDIVSAFESSMTEIEFIAIKPATNGIHPIIVVSFEFRTRPEMSFQQDQYAHKGPSHVGRVIYNMRTYAWTPKELEKFKRYKAEETFELLGVIDESIRSAMDALGEEFERYLEEAGAPLIKKEEFKDDEPKKKKAMNWGILDPFVSVLKGFGELFGALIPIDQIEFSKSKSASSKPSKEAIKKANTITRANAWLTYKNYKKAHRMITW